MERWVLVRKGADYQSIGRRFGIHPGIARLIRNKDIIGECAIQQYLNGTIADLNDGMLMKDMGLAVEILREKIASGSKIRIIGDYDIDGVSATYILLEGLERLGACVDSDIPDRIKDGYGLNKQMIERAIASGIETIITCDNGISATESIYYAKQAGMTVIVTDHHEVPYLREESDDGILTYAGKVLEVEGRRYYLPAADAVVDHKRPDCEYPFKGLCGAAVAYKLMEALYEAMGHDVEEIDDLLEFVGIATVGDVMDLVEENRIFVKQAVEMLERTRNLGLRALIRSVGLDGGAITAYHIGFVIGPCLNAGGRLDTAKRALALFRAKTQKEADLLAGDLKALNESRKELTLQAVEEAAKLVEETELGRDRVLVIYLPDCHESIAGIVAGKVRERYYKPTFVITNAEDGVKGSGRSIKGYHMYEALNQCEDVLRRYGGHELAAGFSLEPGLVSEFRRRLNENCTLTDEDLQEVVHIDMELPFSAVSEEFIQQLKVMEPFGKGNERPVFAARKVRILSAYILGKNKNVLKLNLADQQGTRITGMLFHHVDQFFSALDEKYGVGTADSLLSGRRNDLEMRMTFYPGINEYQGNRTLQLVISHYAM